MKSPKLRVVFLAAGFATRLYPLTRNRAKPLLEVGGAPVLTHVLRQVERCGAAAEGVLVSNARFYGDFVAWNKSTPSAFPIAVIDNGVQENEDRLGALRDLELACKTGSSSDAIDGYLVLACDNLFDFDLRQLVDGFERTGDGQLAVREVPEPVPPGRYSEVCVEGARVVSFREKPADPKSNLSAFALYLLPADLPERLEQYLSEGGEPDAPGHFLAWLHTRVPLRVHRLSGSFFDIGSLADLERAGRDFVIDG